MSDPSHASGSAAKSGGFSAVRSGGIRPWLAAVPVLFLFAAGFAVRLKIAWLDHRFLMAHWLWTDDSLLCMSIARNLAAGLGMTSDGLHVTNGFQPLYVFLLVPIFKMVGPSDTIALIHWAGTIQAILATAAGWMYYCVARRAFNRGAAFWVLFFWAVSHYFVVVESNGMETPLPGLMLGLLVWFYLSRFIQSDRQRLRDFIGLGVLSGLALLARLDAGFLLASIAIDWLWRNRRDLRVQVAACLWTAVSGLIVLSPWLATCWLVRGTIVPDSGQAVRFLSARIGFASRANYFDYRGPAPFDPEDAPWQYAAENVLASATLWAALTPMTSFSQGTGKTHINDLVQRFPVGRIPVAAPWLAMMAVGLFLAGWIAWPLWRSSVYSRLARGGITALRSSQMSPPVPHPHAAPGAPASQPVHREGELDFLRLPIIFWALAYCFHVFGFWYYHRYYYPVILVFTLFSGWFVDVSIRILFPRWPACRNALSGVLVAAYGLVFYPQMSHCLVVDKGEIQYNKNVSVLPWIEQNLPKEARLGSFQSGMYSYFGPQVCVNLDGVVNHDALIAMRERRLWSYICQQRIDYIADVPLCLERYLLTTAGVDPVPIEPVYTEMTMKVYQVSGSGEGDAPHCD